MSRRGKSRSENKHIRERMVGGDDLLDAIQLVHRLHERLADRCLAGQDEAAEALDALLRLKSLMAHLSKGRGGDDA